MHANPHPAGDVVAGGPQPGGGFHGLLDRHRRAHGFLVLLRLRLRTAEHGQHRVAHEFVHHAILAEYGVHQPVESSR